MIINGDITAAGSSLMIMNLLFPAGITITETSDDQAFFECSTPEFQTVTVGLNANQISWKKAVVTTIRISVVPNGQNDKNLKALVRFNLLQPNAPINPDVVQAVFTEAQTGNKIAFANFQITEGVVANSTTTEGRFATNTYTFMGVSVPL